MFRRRVKVEALDVGLQAFGFRICIVGLRGLSFGGLGCRVDVSVLKMELLGSRGQG